MPRMLAPNIGFLPGPKDMLRPSRSSAVRGMKWLNDVVSRSGYGGIELHAGHFLHVAQLRMAPPKTTQRLGRGIFRMHESFFGAVDPQPQDLSLAKAVPKGSFVARNGMRMMLPRGAESLEQLSRIEQKLGRTASMPYVIFSDQAGNFPGAAIQPTADVAAAWGVDSPEGMINELKVRNLRVVWDHFHGDRLGRTSTRRMRQADYLGPLLAAGLVDGVHIGLFRADFKAVDPDRYQLSVNEGQRLVHGESVDDLPLGDLFTQLHDSDWRGDVTIEAAPTGIAAVYGQLPISDVINLHHDMVDTVQGALSHMRWASFPATN